jgi:soluble lytic murein transglycosylase-like protein
MSSARQMAFPSALLGSLIVALLGFLLSAGVSLPAVLDASAAGLETNQSQNVVNDSNSAATSANQTAEQPAIDPTVCAVSEKYPESIRQWCTLITRYSQQYNLDPDLIAALIWQESGGNPLAYSHSGAVGLMQVMPRDGLAANFMCPSGPCFANRPTISELQNPEFNISYGVGMLAGLFNKYGSLREALLYYGPTDVGYYYADIVLGLYERYKK